ncbi:MAG: hypothetical protein R3225_01845 [Halofilum sp. (in: g-proteobacteria)]|nr:hypothetical protein [Halofilum sp. (in: g-proteobacteria)]
MEIQRSGRPPVDAVLVLPGFGRLRVASNEDPSLVTLETPGGARLRMGEKALRELMQVDQRAA